MNQLRPFALGLAGSLFLAATASGQTTEGLRGPEKREQIEATKLSKVPKQTKFVKAEYPKAAEDAGVEATVVLLLDINAEGTVDSVGIAEPAEVADMGFDEAAMAAALQFEFEPAELDGKPIAVQISYRYRFTLTPKQIPAEPPGPERAAPPSADKATGADTPAAPAAPALPKIVNLHGVLLERGTRLPMAGIVVTVFRDDGSEAIGFEATSDQSGRFEFVDLAPGNWKVLIEAPGYYPYRTNETIAKGEALDASYYVERGTYNPYDVTVTAERPKKEVSRTVVTAAQAEKMPGGIGDPLAVIQNFAGVARTESAGILVVRGSDPSDSQTLIDSTAVPLLYHFGGLRTVVPAGMLDSIEFYPGNFPSEYGQATGGIVDVRLKKLAPKKIGGYADVSILDTSLYLEAPLGDKAAVAVAGRRSYIDYIISAAVPDDSGVDLISPPRYYDFQVLGSYRPTPAHEFRAFFFGSDDRFELLFDNPADLDPNLTDNDFGYSTTFYRGILSHQYVPNESFSNSLKLSQGKDWMNMKMAQFFMNMDFLTTEVREKAHLAVDKHFAFNAGFDVGYTNADVKVQLPQFNIDSNDDGPGENAFVNPDSVNIQNKVVWGGGIFAETELTPGAGLLFIPGIRVDRFALTERYSAQPRFTARWALAENTTLKGGLGLFTREGHFLEVNSGFGNPDLTPERAIHYSVGLEHKPFSQLTVDGTLFYKRLTNLVSATDRTVEENGELRPLNYDNNGSGNVRGLELVVRQELYEGLSGWIAYTLSQSKRLESGETREMLFDWDQTHILNIVAAYVLPRNWQLSSRFRLSTGTPTTPVVGSTYNASQDEYVPAYGAQNSARNGTFHQLDLRVDKRWIYDSWILTAYLDIQNVYNRKNPEGIEYNYNYTQSRPQRGLPLLPIIGLRGEF